MDSKRTCGKPGHTTNVISFCLTKDCSEKRLLCGRCIREHETDHNIIFFDEFEENPDKILGAFSSIKQEDFQDIIEDSRSRKEVIDAIHAKLRASIESFTIKIRDHLSLLLQVSGEMGEDMLRTRDNLLKQVGSLCDTKALKELYCADMKHGLHKFNSALNERLHQNVDKSAFSGLIHEYTSLKGVLDHLSKGGCLNEALEYITTDLLKLENLLNENVTFNSKVLVEKGTDQVERLRSLMVGASRGEESDQIEYMREVGSCVEQVVDQRELLLDLLKRINDTKTFSNDAKRYAGEWLQQLGREKGEPSSNRKSMMDEEKKKGVKKTSKPTKPTEQENPKPSPAPADPQQSDGEAEQNGGKPSSPSKTKEDNLSKLCALCERARCTYFCKGQCRRAFHEDCKRRLEDDPNLVVGAEKNDINFDIEESRLDDETMKGRVEMDYRCGDCSTFIVQCFRCKKPGKLPSGDKPKGKDRRDPDEMIRCSTPNCNKFYHQSCIEDDPLYKVNNGRFRCAQHICKVCGDTKNILQCVRCPFAFHTKCMGKDDCRKVGKKNILCGDHHGPAAHIEPLLQKRKYNRTSNKESGTTTAPKPAKTFESKDAAKENERPGPPKDADPKLLSREKLSKYLGTKKPENSESVINDFIEGKSLQNRKKKFLTDEMLA
eukprot:TRINITY_DN5957_c0_g1_i3.p1 TRINITY_DN5957_c0_g1~~TRINITY_DN5957_c0_g1_i3.p1  ORF type:complete len:661 (-),score=161.43 TRINITY_DN5957_c0_g1_i3:167-2149(-)